MMRRKPPHLIQLTQQDRQELERLVRNGRTEQRVARRARVLLAMEDTATVVAELAQRVEMERSAIWSLCRRYEARGWQAVFDAPRGGRPLVIPALERVQIEQLACCEPSGLGLEITHWSSRSLAQVAVERKIIPHVAFSTVALILQRADLQPHRYRYWKTPTLNAAFVKQAAQVLWCYEHVEPLRARKEWIICFDEKPNLQALERRCPKHPMQPGQIERQEFEYLRHGTVNFACALLLHNGHMRGWCLDKNDSAHLCPLLEEMFDEFLPQVKKIHLIWDGGPSHTSHTTQAFLKKYRRQVRVVRTPPHASWLNQGELLLRAFSERYLQRGDWRSRSHLIDHLEAAWPEYNDRFAHPFTWSWTRRNMRQWVARQTP